MVAATRIIGTSILVAAAWVPFAVDIEVSMISSKGELTLVKLTTSYT
jgi:hypothetical protein